MNEDIVALEECEMAAWGDFFRAAPDDVVRGMSLRVDDVNGAVLTSVASVDVLAFNRVLGIGINYPATPDMIDDLVGIFDAAGVRRFFIQVSPAARPPELEGWLVERGFSHYNNWVRLARGTDKVPDFDCDLEVREIGRDEADTFGRIVRESFDWPEGMERVIAGAVGRPGWHHYMAYDGDTPAATAGHFVHGEVAWIDFAATLPEFRGRSAQKALVARRIRDAAAEGCRMIIVETAEQRPDHDAPSYRNMLKMGFEVAYLRPNYIWQRNP
jgi:GNAT superfamily N-acetyltransferase